MNKNRYFPLSPEALKKVTWPRRKADSRLGATCIPLLNPRFEIAKTDRIFTVGSCFARNVEEYLQRANLDVISLSLKFPESEMRPRSRPNDLLVKYTPGSIYAEIAGALDNRGGSAPEECFVKTKNGTFFDLYLPTAYPSVTQDRAFERRQQVSNLFSQIADADVFILTLGLVEHWFDKLIGSYIVAPPNKEIFELFPDRFESRQLNFEENSVLVTRTIEIVRAANQNVRIILTTSPVPLGFTFTTQDVIIANSYSKAVLRVISQEMAAKFDFVDYFPSYEMVTMSQPEITWEDDLRHVRDSMIARVMAVFFNTYFDDSAENEEMAVKFAAAQSKLDTGDITAFDDFKSLQTKFGLDKPFLTAFCMSSLVAGNAEEAERISLLISEHYPSAWADIFRARAKILSGLPLEALTYLTRAKAFRATMLHASGWEMEVGRLLGDADIELSGATSAAEAIYNEYASANKKPWIKNRMLMILRRAAKLDTLERLEPYL